jgi:diguanylate cyclase (GGDEF)-like protein
MRLSIISKLDLAFALALCALIVAGVASFRTDRDLDLTARRLLLGQDVQAVLARAEATVGELQAAEEGLLLRRDSTSLRAYRDASGKLFADIAIVDSLTRDDPAQRQRLRALRTSVDERQNFLAATGSPGDSLSDRALWQRWLVLRARTDDRIRNLRAEERALLRQEGQASRAAAQKASWLARFGLLVAALLAMLGYLLIRSEFGARQLSERRFRESEARFRAALDGSMDAFYILRAVRDDVGTVRDFEFVELNARAETLLQLHRDQLIGKRLCELLPINRTAGYFDRYVKVLHGGTMLEEEFEVETPELSAWIHQQVVPMGDGIAITSRDITQRKQSELALRALSLVDELTGLYNRRGFLTLAEQQLKLARRGRRELLLLFVDMDDFKEINDKFGHREGDVALQRAAQLLRKTFRDSDVVARLGGDEFVVLATDTPRSKKQAVITRLRDELRERNSGDGFPYNLSFSVGVAHFDPAAPPTIEELLETADGMLYEQKKYKPRERQTA